MLRTWLGHSFMLFTNLAAQKGAVQISPEKKKVVIFDPTKMDEWADENKKGFPDGSKVFVHVKSGMYYSGET